MKNSLMFGLAVFAMVFFGAGSVWAQSQFQIPLLPQPAPVTPSLTATDGAGNTINCSGPSCLNMLKGVGQGTSGAGNPAGGNQAAAAAAPQADPNASVDLTDIDNTAAATSSASCPLITLGNQQVQSINSDFSDVLTAKKLSLPAGTNADQHTATASCATQLRANTKKVLQLVSTQDKTNGAGLCALQSKVSSGNYGVSDGMMFAQNKAQAAQTGYAGAAKTFQDTFVDSNPPTYTIPCASAGMSESQTTDETNSTSAPGANGTSTNFSFCSKTCNAANNVVGNLPTECVQIANRLEGLLKTKVGQASCYASSYGTSSLAMKIGTGVAAVAAVAVAVNAYDIHKGANARAAALNNFNNAIISVDGQTVDCKQATTYTATACQQPLMNYCTQTNNLASAGCGAFTQYYCAQAGASVSYCLSGSARTYCGNSVSTVPGLNAAGTTASTFNTIASTTVTLANSPACQWLSSMPQNCVTQPNQLGCLSTMSGTQLATACPNYTSDPICQAYNSGEMVYQPTGGLNNTTVTSGTTTSASTTTPGVPTPVQTNTMGGFTAARVNSRNLFAESSNSLSAICHSGSTQLMGCH